MLLWVISTWLFTLYQQIVFRDEWIQCKIYGVFLAWDLMRDKPVSLFYFVLIYFICFAWWIGFCFWKTTKEEKWCEFLAQDFPNSNSVVSMNQHFTWRDEKGWCPGWLLSHGGSSIDSVQSYGSGKPRCSQTATCAIFLLKTYNSGNTLNTLRGQLVFYVMFSGIIKSITFCTKWS